MDFEKLAKDAHYAHTKSMVEDSLPMIAMMAQANKKYFDDLIVQGFDKKQALELTKAHGLNFYGKTIE